MEKYCRKCRETKSLENFGRHKTTRDGLRSWCKLCVKEYNKNYNEKNKSRLQIQRLKYKLEHKEQTRRKQAALNFPPDLSVLEKFCTKCGSIKPTSSFGKSIKQKDGYSRLCKSCLQIQTSQYRAEHPEIGRRSSAKWVVGHKKEKAALAAKYNRTEAGRNYAIIAAHNRRYAGGILLTKEVISRVINISNGMCVYCGKKIIKGHLDHVIPISKGGTNAEENLVWVCAKCNLSKSNKDLEEFLFDKELINDRTISR